ncbi:MAG: lipopolysaccharide kinase InaA family protein [Prevotella sp.]|jgi:serine/threonine protein kinase
MESRVNPDYHGDAPYIRLLPEHIAQAECECLYTGRNKVYRMALPSGRFVAVKAFKRLDWFHRLWYTYMEQDKARRSYDNGMRLLQLGISTPMPVAWLAERQGRLKTQLYYVCELTDSQPIADFITSDEVFDQSATEALAKFVATLHEKGIIHRDLNNGNIRWREEDDEYHFELIDLNRMKFYPEGTLPPQRVCLQNLTLFSDLTPQYRYFLQCYLSARHLPASLMSDALRIKEKHDRHWKRKKKLKIMHNL